MQVIPQTPGIGELFGEGISKGVSSGMETLAKQLQEYRGQKRSAGALDKLNKGWTPETTREQKILDVISSPEIDDNTKKLYVSSEVSMGKQEQPKKAPLTTNEQINQVRTSTKESIGDAMMEVTIETPLGRIINPEADKNKIANAIKKSNAYRKKEAKDLQRIYKESGLEVPESVKEFTLMDIFETPEALLQSATEQAKKLNDKYKKLDRVRREKKITEDLIEMGYDMGKINQLNKQMAG